MPVVILSGSGNQGMTASLPVIRYAKHLGVDKDKLYRALHGLVGLLHPLPGQDADVGNGGVHVAGQDAVAALEGLSGRAASDASPPTAAR